MIEIVEPSVELITPVDHLLKFPEIIELAARNCYKSEQFANPEKRDEFLTRLLTVHKHESVFEHCSITYRLILSRSASHQEVRHRIQAISQESMRYCDYSNTNRFGGLKVIIAPKILSNKVALDKVLNYFEQGYELYNYLRDNNIPAEDARDVLPHATKTEIVSTMNIRMWRHVIRERGMNAHAQWQIRQLFLAVLYELNTYIPVFFRDLVEELAQRKTKETSNG